MRKQDKSSTVNALELLSEIQQLVRHMAEFPFSLR